jgi:hypothetical protein
MVASGFVSDDYRMGKGSTERIELNRETLEGFLGVCHGIRVAEERVCGEVAQVIEEHHPAGLSARA